MWAARVGPPFHSPPSLLERSQRMSGHARTSFGSTPTACGWSFYARFYAWRFS
jgi:hypothetical protein